MSTDNEGGKMSHYCSVSNSNICVHLLPPLIHLRPPKAICVNSQCGLQLFLFYSLGLRSYNSCVGDIFDGKINRQTIVRVVKKNIAKVILALLIINAEMSLAKSLGLRLGLVAMF